MRQQWNFSPTGSTTEIEHYVVDLDAVSVLELAIRPDLRRPEQLPVWPRGAWADATAASTLAALLRAWRETHVRVYSPPISTFRNRHSAGGIGTRCATRQGNVPPGQPGWTKR